MGYIKMINKWTGSEMYVDESRLDEYESMGHRTALPSTIKEMERKEEPKKEPTELEKAVKRVVRKKKV